MPRKYAEDLVKNEGAIMVFPHYVWELLVAMETRVLIQSTSKYYVAFPTFPIMLHIKCEQDWLTGLRDIQV